MSLIRFFVAATFLITGLTPGVAQTYPASQDYRVQIANLTQDVRRLNQQVGQLQLRVEQLERENRDLKAKSINEQGLDAQMAAMNLKINSAIAALKMEYADADVRQKEAIIKEVSKQMTVLAQQFQESLEKLGKVVGFRGSSAPSVQFSDDYPEKGIAYTVKPGDTLDGIARRHNSTVRDIQNANKIADPRELKAGETIFVPQQD